MCRFVGGAGAQRQLHSFPTRRSSDLSITVLFEAEALRQSRVASTSPFFTTAPDRKSTRLNSSHVSRSYAVLCLQKKTAPCRRSSPAARSRRPPPRCPQEHPLRYASRP